MTTDALEGGSGAGVDRSVPMLRFLLAATLLVMNLADVAIWRALLARGRLDPLAFAPLLEDPAAPLVTKALVTVAVGVLALACPRTSWFADVALLAVLLLDAVVLCWNLGVLFSSVAPL